MKSQFTDELSKLFLFLKSFKNLSLMICDVYNPFIFRFNNIFIRLIIFTASPGSYVSSACLFKLSNSTNSSMVIESNNCFFISSFDRRFAFLLSAKPFRIYKQKIITLIPNLKQKCLSKLIFSESLEAKSYLICSHLFFFTFLF